MIRAQAVATVASVAIQGSACKFRRQQSTKVSERKPANTTAPNVAEMTWNRTVASHISGARIIAEVTPYTLLANGLSACVRAAHNIHPHAYKIATIKIANCGIAPDSEIARSK